MKILWLISLLWYFVWPIFVVWVLVKYLWERLEGDYGAFPARRFWHWTLSGLIVPVLFWVAWNAEWLGGDSLISEIHFMWAAKAPNVTQVLKQAQFFVLLRPSLVTISTLWAGITLVWGIAFLWVHHEYREEMRKRWLNLLLISCPLLLIVSFLKLELFGYNQWSIAAISLGSMLILFSTSGSRLVEPQAQVNYSLAQAKLKFGKYGEAEDAILQQLERWPNDFHGWLLLAELLVKHFNDWPEARRTLWDLTEQKGLKPADVAIVLNRLADWELEYGENPEGAAEALNALIARFPESPHAIWARQRLAHLPTSEFLIQQKNPEPVVIPVNPVKRLGLKGKFWTPPEGVSKEDLLNEYVAQLQAHPMDYDTREKLAILYASEFRRLDLADQQVMELVQFPHQSKKRVVNLLDLLAELYLKYGEDAVNARRVLELIPQIYPDSAFAEFAVQRIKRLEWSAEKRGKPSQSVPMKLFEKRVGLKKNSPDPDQTP